MPVVGSFDDIVDSRTPSPTLEPVGDDPFDNIVDTRVESIKDTSDDGVVEGAARFVRENARTITATGLRVGVPLLSGAIGAVVGGPVGAAVGSALGAGAISLPAQMIQDPEAELSLGEAAVDMGVAAIPGGRPITGVVRNAVKQAVVGGIIGGGETVGRSLVREGELPSMGELALGAGVGGAVGGAVGSVTARRVAASALDDVVEEVVEAGAPKVAAKVVDGTDEALTRSTKVDPASLPPPEVDPETATPGMRQAAPVDDEVNLPATREPAAGGGGRGGGGGDDTTVLRSDDEIFGPSGRPEWDDPLSRLTRLELTPAAHKRIIQLVYESAGAEGINSTTAKRKGERLYKQIAEVLEQHNVDPRIVRMMREGGQGAGQRLNALSQMSKWLNKVTRNDPEAAIILNSIDQASRGTVWGTLAAGINEKLLRPVIDVWRASIVAQIATTTRNAEGQFGRSFIEIVDKGFQGAMTGEGLGRSMELFTAFLRTAARGAAKTKAGVMRRPKPIDEIARILQQSEDAGVRLGPQTIRDNIEQAVGTFRKYGRVINIPNAFQEMAFRRTLFDGTFRGHLRMEGIDAPAFYADPKGFLDNASDEMKDKIQGFIDDSVATALEGTFSAPIREGTVMSSVVGLMQKYPILYVAYPFPRFFNNSLKFLYDFSPLGGVGGAVNWYARKGTAGAMTKAEGAKAVSRAVIGTAMLGAAMAVRNSEMAGDRHDEIRWPGDTFTRVTPLAPFATYLFLAEALNTVGLYGRSMFSTNEDLYEAMAARSRKLTFEEVRTAALNMNRVAGTGLIIPELLFQRQNMEVKQNKFLDLLGQFIGGFTIPYRTARDFVAGYSPEEALIRDVRSESGEVLNRLTAPALGNLPFAARSLPDRPSITRDTVLKSEHPVMRQMLGLNPQTRNKLEIELGRLGVETFDLIPKTGFLSYDREIERDMGRMISMAAPKVMRMPAYIRADDPMRVMIMREMFKRVRKEATKIAAVRAFQAGDKKVIAAIEELTVRRKLSAAERELLKSYGVELPGD